VIVLGFWRPGITCHIATDGRIQNVTGDQAGRWVLAGLTTFTAGQDDAHTLIGLLGHVEPAVPAPRLEPTPPEPPAALVPEPASSPTMDQQHDDEGEQHDRIVRLLSPAADEIEELKEAQPASTTPADEAGADTPLTLRVLGEVSLEWVKPDQRRDITGRFMPKFQEVLVYLALHPQGVRRDRLSATIWPNSSTGGRPFNSFHSALSQIRALVFRATNGQVDNLIEREGDRYRLNSDVVATDYGRFQHLISAHRGPVIRQADVRPLSEAVELYQGELASNLKAAWLEGHREGVRRDVLARLKALIQALNAVDPAEALDVSHEVCRIDPYNEENYRNVMRLQARVGQYQAIPRTLALLSSKLVDIDERPNNETTRLAASLQRPRESRATG
jgi:DNA-binding SARP family transcriptional activator